MDHAGCLYIKLSNCLCISKAKMHTHIYENNVRSVERQQNEETEESNVKMSEE